MVYLVATVFVYVILLLKMYNYHVLEVLSNIAKCKKAVLCLIMKYMCWISCIQARVQQYTLNKMSLKEIHIKQSYVLYRSVDKNVVSRGLLEPNSLLPLGAMV